MSRSTTPTRRRTPSCSTYIRGQGGPGVVLPANWDEIPGARGYTPENCTFRDHAVKLASAGALVYRLSAQPLTGAFAERESIPYPLINDQGLVLAQRLGGVG